MIELSIPGDQGIFYVPKCEVSVITVYTVYVCMVNFSYEKFCFVQILQLRTLLSHLWKWLHKVEYKLNLLVISLIRVPPAPPSSMLNVCSQHSSLMKPSIRYQDYWNFIQVQYERDPIYIPLAGIWQKYFDINPCKARGVKCSMFICA